MASTMVTFANSMSAGLSARLGTIFSRDLALLEQMPRDLGEQVMEHGVGRGAGRLQVLAHRRVDLARALAGPRLLVGLAPGAGLGEVPAQTNQRLDGPGAL